MRTASRPRRSSLSILALGALAAVVAVASDAQPTRPAAAAPADGAQDAIHAVDFAAVAQPGAGCSDALPGPAPRNIGVVEGESALLDEASFARLTVDADVQYADLDDDGVDEAVVRVTCAYGANGAEDTVQVWTASGRLPLLVDTIAAAPDAVADESRFPPGLLDVAVDDAEVVVTYGVYDDDAPNCCPSGQASVTYELDGGLSLVGDAVIEPLA